MDITLTPVLIADGYLIPWQFASSFFWIVDLSQRQHIPEKKHQ
jgi:hypothetical protein